MFSIQRYSCFGGRNVNRNRRRLRRDWSAPLRSVNAPTFALINAGSTVLHERLATCLPLRFLRKGWKYWDKQVYNLKTINKVHKQGGILLKARKYPFLSMEYLTHERLYNLPQIKKKNKAIQSIKQNLHYKTPFAFVMYTLLWTIRNTSSWRKQSI